MKTFHLQIAVAGREQTLVIRAEWRELTMNGLHVFRNDLGTPIAWVPTSIVISISES